MSKCPGLLIFKQCREAADGVPAPCEMHEQDMDQTCPRVHCPSCGGGAAPPRLSAEERKCIEQFRRTAFSEMKDYYLFDIGSLMLDIIDRLTGKEGV